VQGGKGCGSWIGLQDGMFLREEQFLKTTILGNLGNFCDEFILEGQGKVLELLHLLKMQMYIIEVQSC